jgi:hypothetical protein
LVSAWRHAASVVTGLHLPVRNFETDSRPPALLAPGSARLVLLGPSLGLACTSAFRSGSS